MLPERWVHDTGAKHGCSSPDMPLQKRQGVWSPFCLQCEQYLHRVRGLSQPASAANPIAGPESFAMTSVSLAISLVQGSIKRTVVRVRYAVIQ